MDYAPLTTSKHDRRKELQLSIARDQAQLREALSNLQSAMRERTNVRKKIAQEPYPWLAGSFLLGLLWGLRSKS